MLRADVIVVGLKELADSGPRIVVGPAENGLDLRGAYQRFAAVPTTCRAGQPALAIVRTEVLSSPDLVEVQDAERSNGGFRVRIDVLRYHGPLFANVLSISLIGVSLGSLEPGPYEIAADFTVYLFEDLERPERGTPETTSTVRLEFDCMNGDNG